MLIIDTNTLYYIAGLSSPSSISVKKIMFEVKQNGGAMISSVSFAEFLSKYHNHAKIVRRMCAFMRQYHIQICENEIIPFKDDIIKKIRYIRQKELDNVYANLIVLKANAESRFATAIFLTVLACQAVFECNIDPYKLPAYVFDFFSTVFKGPLKHIITGMFEISYRDAYKTDDAENIIRRNFYNCLRMISSLCIPLFKRFIDEVGKLDEGDCINIPQIVGKYSDTDWAEEMTKYQKKIDKQATPSEYLKKRGIIYGKNINDKQLNALLCGLQDSFIKVLGETSIEEYMFYIIKNTISNGGAFRKNDINDALILSNLQEGDIILTFDNGMIEHMEKHAKMRKEYDLSVKKIKSIL